MSTESEPLPQRLAREAGACPVEDVLIARCEEAVCFYPEQLAQFYESIDGRYKDLMSAVEAILNDGHMNTEHLARLRAAWEQA